MKTLTAEEKLQQGIANYNQTASNLNKFQLDEKEVKLFTDIMESYASQFRRQISEQEIERMADEYEQNLTGSQYREFDRYEMERAFADGAKSMLPYTRKQEWISVEERLPEHSDYVLVLVDTYMVLGDKLIGVFYEKGEGQSVNAWNVYDFAETKSDNQDDFKVTHWMPLPESPVNKKEE